MHCSVISEQEFLSMDFQIRGGLAKFTMIFWFLCQEPHSPGYLWDPYRTHHLQSGAFHWSRLLFHPHHDWTAGGSETLPASTSSQSFGLSDEATCRNLTHTMNKTPNHMRHHLQQLQNIPKEDFQSSAFSSQDSTDLSRTSLRLLAMTPLA